MEYRPDPGPVILWDSVRYPGSRIRKPGAALTGNAPGYRMTKRAHTHRKNILTHYDWGLFIYLSTIMFDRGRNTLQLRTFTDHTITKLNVCFLLFRFKTSFEPKMPTVRVQVA